MRQRATGHILGIEAALRELLLEVVRDELRHFREETLETIRLQDRPPPKTEPNPDELLTVKQVAHSLKVIPDTVRTWIQSGALRASRPGRGDEPGRKYRVRRADLKAFVEAMRCRAAPAEGGDRSQAGGDRNRSGSAPPATG